MGWSPGENLFPALGSRRRPQRGRLSGQVFLHGFCLTDSRPCAVVECHPSFRLGTTRGHPSVSVRAPNVPTTRREMGAFWAWLP